MSKDKYPRPAPTTESPCCQAPSTQVDKYVYTCDKCDHRFVLDE